MCQHVTLYVADPPKLSTPAYALASTCLMYAHDSRSPHETWPHLLLMARADSKWRRALPQPARRGIAASTRFALHVDHPRRRSRAASNATPSRSASVRHDRQAVISLGQPRFVTSPAPFPFPGLRRQPLVPVLRQVPEHPAALPHWPSHLAPATIGEEPLSAPSTWFRCRGVLLAHPRHPGTAIVRSGVKSS